MSRFQVNAKMGKNLQPPSNKFRGVSKQFYEKSQQNSSQYCATTKRVTVAADGGHLAHPMSCANTDFDKYSKSNDTTMSLKVADSPGKVTANGVSKVIQERLNQALNQSHVIQQLTKRMGALKLAMGYIQMNLDTLLKTQGVSKDMYAEYLEAHNLLKDQFEFPLKSNEFLYFESVLGKNTTIRNAVVKKFSIITGNKEKCHDREDVLAAKLINAMLERDVLPNFSRNMLLSKFSNFKSVLVEIMVTRFGTGYTILTLDKYLVSITKHN